MLGELADLRPWSFLNIAGNVGKEEFLSRALGSTFHYIGSPTAYGVFYAAAIGFGIIAITWAMWQQKINQKNPQETLISARGSQKWWGITASFFSSSMGAWVLSAPAEVGAVAGWWGVIGYALATALPWTFVAIFGPRLRVLTDGRGFTSVDFVKVRLGRLFHAFFVVLSLGQVFLAFVVEAITIGAIFTTISPDVRAVVITVSLAVITFCYTFFSGIRATLLTDRIQFVLLFCLIIIGVSAIFGEAVPKINTHQIKEVGAFTGAGFICLLVLNVSCFYPTFMDPSTWSRMYAAESPKAARIGLLAAAACLMIPMTFFGAVGIVAQAAVNDGVIQSEASPFFALLTVVRPGWSIALLLLATCLSTSTIDTYSAGFATVVASEIGSRRLNYNWARLVASLVFILALITAIYQPAEVMTIFMIGNLISSITTPVLLLSLWPFVTNIGCACGVLTGFLCVCSFGWARIGGFKGGFDWWLLPEDYYGAISLATFIVGGASTTLVALGVSQLQFVLDSGSYERQRSKFEILAKGTIPVEESSEKSQVEYSYEPSADRTVMV
eukprot:Gregarina_sp_Poly_1__1983@NODE_151_length_12545_cov_99_072047_g134_i0_p3_GENE_NODE_151_length_12545_cov_99_072047_g134_i0NODE_151_length_12545_cov_99_072047_g134_i0_p3_ORF_typecomplete_len556_score59_19SSF/PF00474_17/7_4e02SSF/PF00474_17/4_6e36Transp_cyt_pur/PF02133_15/8_5e03Transp_cyt_pur/PF02133_15/4_1e06SID1_RNA_chan/PF13965_6/2_2SID1_RNA_chan/PF13965_6/0_28_NODE_151_length_12545_cov_99_072047_g134_i051196786